MRRWCSTPLFLAAGILALPILWRSTNNAFSPGDAGTDRRPAAIGASRPDECRQCVDAGFSGAGAADDRPRPGAVLRRPGAPKKHPRHHDAELRHDGTGDHALGRSSATRWPSVTATAFIGGFEHVFLRGVGLTPNPDYAATIPEQTFMIYQLMFAIITPALITGAFAERMKFSAMAVFLSLWSLLVYCPMAHMVWGVGGLLNASGGHFPSLDFAGGTVVHITSRRLGARLRALPGQAHRLSAHGHAAALHGAQLHRRLPAVGGLVRLQCRQRPRLAARWPPAPSSTPTLPPPPRPSAGPSSSGSITASPPRSARFQAQWPAWSPSLPLRASCSHSRRCSSALPRAFSASSWSS